MQISQSLQNTYTSSAITTSQQSLVSTNESTSKQTDSINKNAYTYFDLGEDVSQYTEIDPVQEQTNKDIVNYLSGFMNNTSSEGIKNFNSFETLHYGAILSADNMSKEEFQRIETDLISMTNKHANLEPNSFSMDRRYVVSGSDGEYIEGMNMQEMKDFLGEDYAKNAVLDLESIIEETGIFHITFNERQKQYEHEMRKPTLIPTLENTGVTKVTDAHRLISLEEANKLNLERFKNLYSFSDEFSKTEKFEELYDIYKVKLSEKMDDIFDSYKRTYEVVDSKEYLTAEVAKQGFSKSEAIDYYETVSNELKDMLSWRGLDDTTNIVSELKESIKLYDKIASGLKDMWDFGDLNVSA